MNKDNSLIGQKHEDQIKLRPENNKHNKSSGKHKKKAVYVTINGPINQISE